MNGDRSALLNIIILNRKSYLKFFFFYNNIDRNIAMDVSDTEYNNDELSVY